MGRNRKWVLEDNIQDAVWKTILRGPRPPSVRWEKHRSSSAGAISAKKDAKLKNSVQVRQSKALAPKVVPSQPRTVRQSPPEAFTAARAKVLRLEAALSALGDADTAEKENLERALLRARAQAVVPPISEQIISTQGFIERERKRLAAAEAAVLAAVKSRDESVAALAQGEQRLSELKLQETTPFTVPVTDTETELVRLRAQVAELQGLTIGERPRMRAPVETMPGLVPAEFSTWMEDRQRDVQEALSKGDHIRVAELSAMITKGAERMVEMTRQEISDEEFQSRAAPGEGRFAPY